MYFLFQYVPYKNDDYKKPFFFAYTKASMFTIYFLVYIIYRELQKPCGNQTSYMVVLNLLIHIKYLLVLLINYIKLLPMNLF